MTAPPSLSDLLSEIKSTIRLKSSDDDKTPTKKTDDATAASSPILALYFSSAWCDDSQESHEPVTNVFQSQHQHSDPQQLQQQQLFDLVYVSSDTSAEELEGNLEKGWHYIPFDEEELRSNLKRHFGICAKKEMDALGISTEQRKGGIPTLILMDVQKEKVLLDDAIPHVMGDTKLDDPLVYWMSLLSGDRGDGTAATSAEDNTKDPVKGTQKAAADEPPPDEKEAKKQKVEEE
jgi:nucleoredoxin